MPNQLREIAEGAVRVNLPVPKEYPYITLPPSLGVIPTAIWAFHTLNSNPSYTFT
jgi:hypothetical protein